MQSPKRDQVPLGRKPGDPVANEAVAASRTTLKVGHEAPGLGRPQSAATSHDGALARESPEFLSEAPLPGQRDTLKGRNQVLDHTLVVPFQGVVHLPNSVPRAMPWAVMLSRDMKLCREIATRSFAVICSYVTLPLRDAIKSIRFS